MELASVLDLLMLAVVLVALLAGFPVAYTLGGAALIFAGLGTLSGSFDGILLSAIPQRLFGIMTSQTLIAVPFFVFMGVVLERSQLAADLIRTTAQLFARLPGGMGIAVFLVGALLAASTGVVGASVVMLSVIALPVMIKQGYPVPHSCGAVAASGTLGQIIPPSIVLIILGDQISNAAQVAKINAGIFGGEPVTVSDLFAGAFLPGLLLVGLFLAYQIAIAWLKSEKFPPILPDELSDGDDQPRRPMIILLAPLVMIAAVLGSILFGIATPTEAAAVGAAGALLLAGMQVAKDRAIMTITLVSVPLLLLIASSFDLRVGRAGISGSEMMAIGAATLLIALLFFALYQAIAGLKHRGVLQGVLDDSARMTTTIFLILIGATIFSLVFRGLGGDERVAQMLAAIPGGTFGAILAVMVMIFLLGFFLDFVEIIFIVVPLVVPGLLAMNLDDGSPVSPIWIGVLIAMNLQTSFLTPPFGFALFYLRSAAPRKIATKDIYRGVMPFVMLQLLALAILAAFPALATWLPELLLG